MFILNTYNDIDKRTWGAFVKNHPEGNIFQTPEMYEVYAATPKYEPHIFVVYSDEKEIIGCLLSVVQKEHKGILGRLSSRSIIMGGPLLLNNDQSVLDLILKDYNIKLGKKVIYSQFRNLFDTSDLTNIFKNNGYYYEDHLDIWVDLNKTEAELWKDVSSTRRNEIKRAEKEGVVVKEYTDLESLKSSYNILKEVYNRAKIPLADIDLFNNALNVLGEKKMIRFLGAYYKIGRAHV